MMKHPEDQIQKAIVEHLKYRGVPGMVWFHPANGGFRNKIEAARFRGLGVRPGVSDLIMFHRGHFYALELKADKGTPTALQREFLMQVTEAGGHAKWAAGVDQAVDILLQWGLIR